MSAEGVGAWAVRAVLGAVLGGVGVGYGRRMGGYGVVLGAVMGGAGVVV